MPASITVSTAPAETGAVLNDVLSVNPERAGADRDGMGREKWENDGNTRHPCPKPFDLMGKLITALTPREAVDRGPYLTGSEKGCRKAP